MPELPKGKVTVDYVNTVGNQIADGYLVGYVGKSYIIMVKVIENYKLIQTPANAEGTFTKEDITATCVYRSSNLGNL